jgi:hypothetical protein
VRELAWLTLTVYAVYLHGLVMLMLAFGYFKAANEEEFLGYVMYISPLHPHVPLLTSHFVCVYFRSDHYDVGGWQVVCAAIGVNLVSSTGFIGIYMFARHLERKTPSQFTSGVGKGSVFDDERVEERRSVEDVLVGDDIELESA